MMILCESCHQMFDRKNIDDSEETKCDKCKGEGVFIPQTEMLMCYSLEPR